MISSIARRASGMSMMRLRHHAVFATVIAS